MDKGKTIVIVGSEASGLEIARAKELAMKCDVIILTSDEAEKQGFKVVSDRVIELPVFKIENLRDDFTPTIIEHKQNKSKYPKSNWKRKLKKNQK